MTWVGRFTFSNVNFMKCKYSSYISNINIWSKWCYAINVKVHSFFFLSFFFFLPSFLPNPHWIICLLIFRERGNGERERGTPIGCLQYVPRYRHWGSNLQPRFVPWLGSEPTTFWFKSIFVCLYYILLDNTDV